MGDTGSFRHVGSASRFLSFVPSLDIQRVFTYCISGGVKEPSSRFAFAAIPEKASSSDHDLGRLLNDRCFRIEAPSVVLAGRSNLNLSVGGNILPPNSAISLLVGLERGEVASESDGSSVDSATKNAAPAAPNFIAKGTFFPFTRMITFLSRLLKICNFPNRT